MTSTKTINIPRLTFHGFQTRNKKTEFVVPVWDSPTRAAASLPRSWGHDARAFGRVKVEQEGDPQEEAAVKLRGLLDEVCLGLSSGPDLVGTFATAEGSSAADAFTSGTPPPPLPAPRWGERHH